MSFTSFAVIFMKKNWGYHLTRGRQKWQPFPTAHLFAYPPLHRYPPPGTVLILF